MDERRTRTTSGENGPGLMRQLGQAARALLRLGGRTTPAGPGAASRATPSPVARVARPDPLAELPSRLQFNEELRRACQFSAEVALLRLDLDRFEAVNDTYGFAAGDALLRAVAGRLRNCVAAPALATRLGGDKFAVLYAGPDGRNRAGHIARRVCAAISRPYQIDGWRLVIGARIGIAVGPADGGTPEDLFRNADIALRRARQAAGSGYDFFAPDPIDALPVRKAAPGPRLAWMRRW